MANKKKKAKGTGADIKDLIQLLIALINLMIAVINLIRAEK